MDNSQKAEIEARNQKIRDGILVSQMCEHPGFKVLKAYLDEKTKAIRYQDILGLKDMETVNNQQGIAICLDDIDSFFTESQVWAAQPMQDPDTGIYETLNNKK